MGSCNDPIGMTLAQRLREGGCSRYCDDLEREAAAEIERLELLVRDLKLDHGAELQSARADIADLQAAEEGAKTAFGHVVEQKQAAERECMRLQGLLAAAYADIRRAALKA
jgi:hypothetical protein